MNYSVGDCAAADFALILSTEGAIVDGTELYALTRETTSNGLRQVYVILHSSKVEYNMLPHLMLASNIFRRPMLMRLHSVRYGSIASLVVLFLHYRSALHMVW